MQPYVPEQPRHVAPTVEALYHAAAEQTILQAMCIKCDEHHNLHIDLGKIHGVIPREEAVLGLSERKVKEIAVLSRVGKAVSFRVLGFDCTGNPILSRRAAQLEARSYFLNTLHTGDILSARVQSCADFGVFCDIGCGFTALMPIDRCCISRLHAGTDLYRPGMPLCAAIWKIDDQEGQILLTGRELLGTWEENAEKFRQGQTVTGIVRSVMPYGIFVELTPNLSGLAEFSPEIRPGDAVSVFLRAIIPAKHKIKLNILEKLDTPPELPHTDFFITSGHISKWEYFPGSKSITSF